MNSALECYHDIVYEAQGVAFWYEAAIHGYSLFNLLAVVTYDSEYILHNNQDILKLFYLSSQAGLLLRFKLIFKIREI